MIPQMTVVVDLTRSEDWLSLKPGLREVLSVLLLNVLRMITGIFLNPSSLGIM